jgi:hypothetical protein
MATVFGNVRYWGKADMIGRGRAVVSTLTISAYRLASQVAAPRERVASLLSDGAERAFNNNHK